MIEEGFQIFYKGLHSSLIELCSLSSSVTPDIVVSPVFKEASDMEEKQF